MYVVKKEDLILVGFEREEEYKVKNRLVNFL